MSVPAYEDLDNNVKEVIRNGYAFDVIKLKIGQTPITLGFESECTFNLKTFKSAVTLTEKYKSEAYGGFSAKCSTDGLIVGEYSLNGIISENLDLRAGWTLNYADTFQSAKLLTKFHNSILHAKCSLTKDFDRSVDLLGTSVVKFGNFLLGYQCGYDANTSRLTKNDLSLTFDQENFTFQFRCIRIPREFGLSGFYKVNENFDLAADAKMACREESRLWYLCAGFAYKLDEQYKLRMKIDKNLQLGTSLQFRLHDNLLLALGISLDLQRPTNGQHKVGIGLDIFG